MEPLKVLLLRAILTKLQKGSVAYLPVHALQDLVKPKPTKEDVLAAAQALCAEDLLKRRYEYLGEDEYGEIDMSEEEYQTAQKDGLRNEDGDLIPNAMDNTFPYFVGTQLLKDLFPNPHEGVSWDAPGFQAPRKLDKQG